MFQSDSTPVVPHRFVQDVDCCGCLIAIERNQDSDLICNECRALITSVPTPDVEKTLSEMLLSQQEICSATCPHCGAANIFPGLSAIEAYTCSACGQGVSSFQKPPN
jgi:hypothetical protein